MYEQFMVKTVQKVKSVKTVKTLAYHHIPR